MRLAPDLDEVPALSLEREALWKRVNETSFLTDDEKRAATGYEPLPHSSLPAFAPLAKYDPNQPRVPAGNSDGGQWTSGGYGVGNERVLSDANPDELVPGAQYVQSKVPHDVLNKHIIDDHVGKTDEQLIARIRKETLPGIFVTTGRDRNGAFDSVDSAGDFIRRTIEYNQEAVARVISGQSDGEFLTWRFGYETGREAILDPETSSIRIRKTYEVGVVIIRDKNSVSGYRVISAYPRNFNPRIGR